MTERNAVAWGAFRDGVLLPQSVTLDRDELFFEAAGSWVGCELRAIYAGPPAAPFAPLGLSALPWKYVNTNGNPVKGMADWIEDAAGNIVVENVGHIDGPFIVAHANAAAPEVESALRYGYAAIESLLEQVQQMRGMFNDEDGAIQRAVDDGDAAIADIAKALAKIA